MAAANRENARPRRLILWTGEVHLWLAFLDLHPTESRALADLLSPEERERAERYRSERHRGAFVVRRALLRQILGTYLGTDPSRLVLEAGPQGKPRLKQASRDLDLRFNLSHSDNLALYAVTDGIEVGVDLERIRAVLDADRIIARFFSVGESDAYRSVSPERKREAFYAAWTRKEAYLKALGEGLTRPLDGFEVSLRPGEPARLLHVAGDPGEAPRWSLFSFVPHPGTLAAVAARTRLLQPTFGTWNRSPSPARYLARPERRRLADGGPVGA